MGPSCCAETVSVTGGVLATIRLTSPTGEAVAGQLSTDKTGWAVSEPLGYNKTYTWSGTAIIAPVPVFSYSIPY